MKLWKRNAVVAAIVLFVCVAVYLNWSYDQSSAVNGSGAMTSAGSDRISEKYRYPPGRRRPGSRMRSQIPSTNSRFALFNPMGR